MLNECLFRNTVFVKTDTGSVAVQHITGGLYDNFRDLRGIFRVSQTVCHLIEGVALIFPFISFRGSLLFFRRQGTGHDRSESHDRKGNEIRQVIDFQRVIWLCEEPVEQKQRNYRGTDAVRISSGHAGDQQDRKNKYHDDIGFMEIQHPEQNAEGSGCCQDQDGKTDIMENIRFIAGYNVPPG